MRYPVTIVATLIGIALCIYNYSGYDPHNFVFFMFSIPGWVVDFFIDTHEVNVFLMYVLTIASYAIIGLICDWMVARDRQREHSSP